MVPNPAVKYGKICERQVGPKIRHLGKGMERVVVLLLTTLSSDDKREFEELFLYGPTVVH